jgi:hypothetical protein
MKEILKAIWNIMRAMATAPDVAHWILKYDAAKKENDRLRQELAAAKVAIKTTTPAYGHPSLSRRGATETG